MNALYSLILGCSFLTSQVMLAQTWNGSISSDWNNSSNWTPGSVPGTGANVTINNASAPFHPTLPADITISTLSMSAGILNLNGYTLTCSGQATISGDSLYNGKLKASTFNNLANMHMGGHLVIEKTGASNEFWQGKNRFYGDSLIIIWRLGSLYMENAVASPDSIFGHLKLVYSDNNQTTYRINVGVNSNLYVRDNLILDNPDKGTFGLDYVNEKKIGGNIKALDFSSAVPNLPMNNVVVLGNNFNGPFYSHVASISNCRINGSISLIADSSVISNIHNSVFSGEDVLLQSGSFDMYGNEFGIFDLGKTRIIAAHNLAGDVYIRSGNNKFLNDVEWESYAKFPGVTHFQHNWYGADSSLRMLTFLLKGNSRLYTNGNGHNYVQGDLIIDGQGYRKYVEFTGGAGNDFVIEGNIIARNFSPNAEPGVGITNVYLHNVFDIGAGTSGVFYCITGNIMGCGFNGDFTLIADSSQTYSISNSYFNGTNNFIKAGAVEVRDSKFGHYGTGSTSLVGAHNIAGTVYMRGGNNKFYHDVQWETFAQYPGSITVQQNFYGADSITGNLKFLLKGNSLLATNENGHNYVSGDLVIDGAGAKKWVQFTGGDGNTFTVKGNFKVNRFSRFSEPGVGITNVYLRNLFVDGTDTCGTFFCYGGDITNSSFKGNFRIIADSSQTYFLTNSTFGGAENWLQAGAVESQQCHFGSDGTGSTTLIGAHNIAGIVYMRDGNNKFSHDLNWMTYAAYPGVINIQQNFYGVDTVLGNLQFSLKGNSTLTTNGNGNNYVGGNVVIDGAGARKWVQFTGGAGNNFNVQGNFSFKNFTPFSEPGVGNSNVYLRNVFASGTDTVGTIYCITGDITNSSFKGDVSVIADSSQPYGISNSIFSGANNYLQAGNFDIQHSKFGQSSVGTTHIKVAHNVAGAVYFRDGNNKFIGNLQLDAIAPSVGTLNIQHTFFGPDTCMKDFILSTEGNTNVNLGGNNFYIGGDCKILNNGKGTILHDNGTSAIIFNGSDTSDYLSSGTGSTPSFLNLVIKRQGGLRLQSPLSVNGALTFIKGIILSSLDNLLQISNNAQALSAWDSSYVKGPVRKIGNAAFTYPLGDHNVYAPMHISSPASSTDIFDAEYRSTPVWKDGYDTLQKDVSLDHLSRREYWILNRSAGSSAVKVELSWNKKRSGEVDQVSDLRVARWNGSTWKDEGIGVTTGDNESGTIETNNSITNFSPFTLASATPNNALPVSLMYFTAQCQINQVVQLRWETSANESVHYYEVEKYFNSAGWTKLDRIYSNTSNRYSYNDYAAQEGMNQYRIKMVNIDGVIDYSLIRSVKVSGTDEVFIWPNPAHQHLYIKLPFEKSSIYVYSSNGELVYSNITSSNYILISAINMKAGVYSVVIRSGNRSIIKNFIKQ